MKGLIKDVGVAVIIVAMTLQFYEPTRVFGISMQPNFDEKDYLILSREAFNKEAPKYGDVVVFQSTLKDSQGRDELLIKRIIGVPGDRIEIKDGSVYVNGQVKSVEFAKEGVTSGNIDLVVPEGSYFCLGDNREHSTDSRSDSVGCVPEEEIKGKVIFRFFPFRKIGRIRTDGNS